MNRDDIERLWHKAYVNGMLPFEQRERFAALVAAAEREACARVAADEGLPVAFWIAEKIRARGKP